MIGLGKRIDIYIALARPLRGRNHSLAIFAPNRLDYLFELMEIIDDRLG